jgi:beta-phosphoglucomutase
MSPPRADFVFEGSGAIFDLDGVLVDTARYHYLAWRRLAHELGFAFTAEHNERLKGVSRQRSLEILLEIGGLSVPLAQRDELATRKNAWYVEMISQIGPGELLPGAGDYVALLRQQGKRIALGSASRNARPLLERLAILDLFDAIIDGHAVARAKPDPEVFVRAAAALGVPADACVVFEDAQAGIDAARNAGMRVVGIGDPFKLQGADIVVSGLDRLLP